MKKKSTLTYPTLLFLLFSLHNDNALLYTCWVLHVSFEIWDKGKLKPNIFKDATYYKATFGSVYSGTPVLRCAAFLENRHCWQGNILKLYTRPTFSLWSLLKYNWQRTLCKFKVYNVLIWHTDIFAKWLPPQH